jgi:hypothetical protein
MHKGTEHHGASMMNVDAFGNRFDENMLKDAYSDAFRTVIPILIRTAIRFLPDAVPI